MRRVSGVVLAGVMLMAPVLFVARDAGAGQDQGQQQAPALTFDGEVALWSVGVLPDKTGDFEAVMRQLRDVLRSSEKPERRQQAAGWRILRGPTNPSTGHVIYTHVLNPVVRGANYSILELIYEAVEDHEERTRIYEQYRGAFGGNLGASTGRIVLDFTR